jgi:hypothetical protein
LVGRVLCLFGLAGAVLWVLGVGGYLAEQTIFTLRCRVGWAGVVGMVWGGGRVSAEFS